MEMLYTSVLILYFSLLHNIVNVCSDCKQNYQLDQHKIDTIFSFFWSEFFFKSKWNKCIQFDWHIKHALKRRIFIFFYFFESVQFASDLYFTNRNKISNQKRAQ